MSIQGKGYRCKWMRVDSLNPVLKKLRKDDKDVGRAPADG